MASFPNRSTLTTAPCLGYLTWSPKQPGNPLLLFILPLVALGVIGAGILTWTMILRLKKASDELADREALSRHQALHDALSGLPNRHNFVERLQELLDGVVQTRNNERVVVAYVDVDRFKDINDTMGHQAGDALIMAVASPSATRAGGERLLGALRRRRIRRRVPRPATTMPASALADRLRGAFAEAFDVYGQHVRMTASIGLAMAPPSTACRRKS